MQAPAIAIVSLAALAWLVGAAPALAGLPQEFAVFNDCPVNAPGVSGCAVSTVTGGEFVIGSKTVTINKTVTLQGGYNPVTGEIVPALDGNTLSKTPLTVPGGLVGIGEIGGEVTATAELAGTAFLFAGPLGTGEGTAVSLPVKVKLSNPALGNECYIGSNSEPVALQLTTGTTHPPEPNKPISGKFGTAGFTAGHKIATVTNDTLVDNSFAAPGVNGCGGILATVLDPVVDLDAGLPAAAGHNTAILEGKLESAGVATIKAQRALPELGRCTKVAAVKVGKEKKYSGGYRDSGCIEEASLHEGQYEWAEGPGAGRKFTGSSAKVTLETIGHTTVKCSASTASGEYAGAKALTETLTFSGCVNAAKESCQSAGAGSGEVVTSPLEGSLGFVTDQAKGESELIVSVGLDLKHEPSLVSAECGSAKAALLLKGSVIAPFSTADKMAATSTLKYSAPAGRQVPEQFEGEAKDTLVSKLGTGPEEQAGLTATEKITDEEKLEIKAQAE